MNCQMFLVCVCAQYRQRSPFVRLGRYTVDFRVMRQRNDATGFERAVRCSMSGRGVPGLRPCETLRRDQTTQPRAPLYGGREQGSAKTASAGASAAQQQPLSFYCGDDAAAAAPAAPAIQKVSVTCSVMC